MSRVVKLAAFNIIKFTKQFECDTVSLRPDVISKDFSKGFTLPSTHWDWMIMSMSLNHKRLFGYLRSNSYNTGYLPGRQSIYAS